MKDRKMTSMKIFLDYDIICQILSIKILHEDGLWDRFVEHNINKNFFLQLKKALESKVGSLLNCKSNYLFVRSICKQQIQNKELLDYELKITYRYGKDTYEILEEKPILMLCQTKNKTYKIKNNTCNCMSFKIGNSKFGKDNCKHLEMIKVSPIEMYWDK
jgi:predicted nucleic acid-binding Zn finger protein